MIVKWDRQFGFTLTLSEQQLQTIIDRTGETGQAETDMVGEIFECGFDTFFSGLDKQD